eukprot:m.254429 g.254429  ORF g.254429 m.254429 type:complete len:193 (+) comp18946_c0_seq1:23-601(+)
MEVTETLMDLRSFESIGQLSATHYCRALAAVERLGSLAPKLYKDCAQQAMARYRVACAGLVVEAGSTKAAALLSAFKNATMWSDVIKAFEACAPGPRSPQEVHLDVVNELQETCEIFLNLEGIVSNIMEQTENKERLVADVPQLEAAAQRAMCADFAQHAVRLLACGVSLTKLQEIVATLKGLADVGEAVPE